MCAGASVLRKKSMFPCFATVLTSGSFQQANNKDWLWIWICIKYKICSWSVLVQQVPLGVLKVSFESFDVL